MTAGNLTGQRKAAHVLSISLRRVCARFSRSVAPVLAAPGRRRQVLGLSVGLAAVGIALSWYAVAFLGLIVAVWLGLANVRDRALRGSRLEAAIKKSRDLSQVARAERTLAKMGVDEGRIAELMSRAGVEDELQIAEFDQNNRIASNVGPIPLFGSALIERGEFQKRSRNRVEIVLISDVVALKKRYRDFTSFRNEVIALDALEHLDGVPKIVAVDRQEQTLCQSFLPGHNLGTLMVAKGASVSSQYQAGRKYPGIGGWSQSTPIEADRASVLKAQRELVDEAFIADLQNLAVSVHAACVALRDVKHGNIIISDGTPSFCDFDFARVHLSNGMAFTLEREEERDKFNYLFDGALPTSHSLLKELRRLKSDDAGATLPSVYFGTGYSLGRVNDSNNATVLWRVIRRQLLQSVGASAIDLGSSAGVIALELLRAGVQRVRTYEPDPRTAQFTQLCHRFFEFVDNRVYNLQCVPHHPSHVSTSEPATYDTAVAINGLSGFTPEQLQQLFGWMNENVQSLVIVCPREPTPGREKSKVATAGAVRALLEHTRFTRRQESEFPGGWLIVAARDARAPTDRTRA